MSVNRWDLAKSLAPPRMVLPDAFLGELVAAYERPPRVYHTFEHAIAVAEEFDRVRRRVGWREPEPTYLAVLAHDAVYEPGRSGENERRSADLARDWAERYWPDAGWGERAAFLVLQTAAHYDWPVGEDLDLDLFLDCDLAILGAAEPVYDAYAAGIRAEFSPVVGDAYEAGRRDFLESLSARRSLFRSDYFRERLDDQARRNVARELETLETGA